MIELLSDKDLLKEEREQAQSLRKKMRGHMKGTGSGNPYGSITS